MPAMYYREIIHGTKRSVIGCILGYGPVPCLKIIVSLVDCVVWHFHYPYLSTIPVMSTLDKRHVGAGISCGF